MIENLPFPHGKLNDFIYTVSMYRRNYKYSYLYYITGSANEFYLMTKERQILNPCMELVHEKYTAVPKYKQEPVKIY